MFGVRHCRWFPAVVLVAVFPVALVPQSGFRGSAEDSTTATAGVPDVPSPPPSAVPRPQLSHQEMGDLYLARRSYQAAIGEYTQAEPRSAGVWNGMGVAYQMLFDSKDAIRCYKQAIRRDHKNMRALNNLATVYDSQKNFPQAERYYRKALKLNPKSAAALKNLGTNLLMQHKDKKGEELYRLAVRIDPGIFTVDRGAPAIASPVPVQDLGRANYQKARSCARAGVLDCALSYLRKSINEGAVTPQAIAAESDFNAIRSRPEFQKLLKILE